MEEKEKKERGGVKILAMLGVGLLLGYFLGNSSTKSTPGESTAPGGPVELTFVNHLQAELPEQDVFILSSDNSDEVMRIDVGEDSEEVRSLAAYSTLDTVGHDPFKIGESPLGPFEIGPELGFTVGDWLSATGTGVYSTENGRGTLAASFENLVPNGVYTVWCSRLKFPPAPAVVDAPCGALDGSENAFTADSEGNGSIEISLTALRSSTEAETEIIALAYHSDGETYGSVPGEFGSYAHIQIFVMVPPAGAN